MSSPPRKNRFRIAKATGRSSTKAKSKSNAGASKATSKSSKAKPERLQKKTKGADYEILIFYQCEARKGEIQRLGFTGSKKYSEAFKEARRIVKLLTTAGAYETDDLLIVGLVRTQFYERWYDFNLRRRDEAKAAMAKRMADIKKTAKKGKGKKVKAVKPISWVNPMSTDIFKTRG